MSVMAETFAPPPLPPPLLTEIQLAELAYQGHIPITLPERLQNVVRLLDEASHAFFEHDKASKSKAHPNAQGTELGYYVVEGEKEYVTLRHSQRPTSIEADLEQSCGLIDRYARDLWRMTAAVMHRILMDVSAYTGIDPVAWDPVLDGCLELPEDSAHMTPSLLRLFRYEPSKGVAGEHTDNGILTLCVGTEKGLQVWRKDFPQQHSSKETNAEERTNDHTSQNGHWVDVQGPVLLAGTTLRILTTDYISAGKHRVVSNPNGRRSIVFALRPSTKHHLELAPFGGEGSWDMALLWKTITTGRVNINATQALREEQTKKRQEARKKQSQTG